MALTPASVLADYSSGIGTQGATLKVNTSDKRVGIGTTNPQGTLQVGTGITMGSGIITATAADFSGNLTVGGVLTYEDVTSVDSVGVITARSGIEVGSGVTITTTNVNLIDNGKIQLGNGNDLQIYHDTNNSVIKDNGAGKLILDTDGAAIEFQKAGLETIATFNADGAIELRHDNVKKFETTSTGAVVSGILTATTLEQTQTYPTIRPTLDLNFAATKSLDRRITFTRDGVGTFTDELGIIKYASNNVPRFDHDPTTGESLGLLIEESRTNFLGLSSDLTDNNGNDWDNINGTIAVNQTTAPDGTTTAASFTASAGNAEHSVVFAELVPTGNVTVSVWVKTNTYSIVSFVMFGEANSTVSYNINTKTVYNQGSNVSRATITEYPNGWYRISATMNCTVADSRTFRLFASTGNFDAGGTESFYYWGPQLESGSFETSYIPTYVSNTSVTRGADNAVIKGTNFTDFHNATEGTLVSEHMGAGDAAVSPYIALLSDGTNDERIILMSDFAGYQVVVVNAGSNQAILDGGTPILNAKNKNATAFKKDDFALSLNGGTVATDTSGIMSVVDQLWIGSRNGADSYMNNTIQSLKYYNKRLPNAQLQGLTA